MRVPAAILPAPFLSSGRSATGEGGESGNRRADVYRLGSFQYTSGVCSPSVSMVQLGFPGVAAVRELLRRQIKILSGDGGGYCVFSGEVFVRSLLACPVIVDIFSNLWSDGRRSGLLPVPFVLWGWLMRVQRNRSTGDGPRCGLLQHFPSSLGRPSAWRKEDLAGLQSDGVAGVIDDGRNIAGCVRLYLLYRSVSCKKVGVCCTHA
ncbi:hypothetical protein SETIT_4G096500v2 [Setaria italica]|uniref:Uncharacterized protein n=1 Tax=Setaria italica TaxID=4555 RepID=A0A368QSH5_SETIT|nr:uncharacterized protein LOC111257107 [Setaria italica]RCV20917.1 hypothetical protein SETIT_4G096500v2 [Setaria italica]